MASFKEVIVALGGYPIKSIIDDAVDLYEDRKILRNIIILTTATLCLILGAIIPLLIAPDYGDYLKSIIFYAISLGSFSGTITATIINMWGTAYVGILASKHVVRLGFYYHNHDTNSDHLMTQRELNKLVATYEIERNVTEHELVRADVLKIFDFLVKKIRKSKQLDGKPNPFGPLDSLTRDLSKAEFKYILREFRTGNIEPYETYTHLEKKKREMNIEKLNHRITLLWSTFSPLETHLDSETQSAMRPQLSVEVPEDREENLPIPRSRTRSGRASRISISLQATPKQIKQAGQLLDYWVEKTGTNVKNEETTDDIKNLTNHFKDQIKELRNPEISIPVIRTIRTISIDAPPTLGQDLPNRSLGSSTLARLS